MFKRSHSGRSRPSVAFWLTIAVAIAVACGWGKAKAEPTAYPTADAARFSVEVIGDGPDVILIPGLGSSRAVWDGTVARFKGQYRFHVLQVAGFAGEPAGANASGPVVEPVSAAIAAYVADKGLKSPIIVGHSIGGLMGLVVARDHPEALSKLIVVDTLPYYAVLFDPAATVERVRPQAESLKQGLIGLSDADYIAQQAPYMARMARSEADRQRLIDWGLASDRGVLAQSLFDDLTIDMRADLGRIAAPVTVILPYSSATPYSAEQTEGFYAMQYQGVKSLHLKRIDDSAHFIMWDQPEAFYTALDAALRGE